MIRRELLCLTRTIALQHEFDLILLQSAVCNLQCTILGNFKLSQESHDLVSKKPIVSIKTKSHAIVGNSVAGNSVAGIVGLTARMVGL